MLLTGTYPKTLDDKKRLALPKRVRVELNEPAKVFVSPGPDQCLWLYSQEGLEPLSEKLDKAPATDKEVLAFRRLFFGKSELVDVDRNGRILVPDRLIQFAGLKHDVVLIGVQDRLELWDAERWREYEAQHSSQFDAVAEKAFQK